MAIRWWVRCVARNGRIVGTSQEGYRNKQYAVRMAEQFSWPRTEARAGWRAKVVKTDMHQFRWHIVAANGEKVFGSHETLTSRSYAKRMAYRVLTEAHELEVRG